MLSLPPTPIVAGLQQATAFVLAASPSRAGYQPEVRSFILALAILVTAVGVGGHALLSALSVADPEHLVGLADSAARFITTLQHFGTCATMAGVWLGVLVVTWAPLNAHPANSEVEDDHE